MAALKNSIRLNHFKGSPSPLSLPTTYHIVSTGIWVEVNGVLKKLENITATTDKNLQKVKLIELATSNSLIGYYYE